MMKLYTIGFTGKTAREFFDLLNGTDAAYLADIRLKNNSQLAGFTKRGHIDYFTEKLTRMSYVELPFLAPSEQMFRDVKRAGDWELYERRYAKLMEERDGAGLFPAELVERGAVLLCTERTPDNCHRRLAAEHLRAARFPELEILHL